jgi:uncharacterized protein YndB with AHSA1/START domain
MQQIEVVRRFPQPPERVWEVYTDHARWSEWSGFPKSRLEREGDTERNGRGAVRGFSGGGVSVHEQVLEFEPPKRMTYRIVRGGFPLRNHLGEVRLEPAEGGTLLVWRCQFDSAIPGLGGLARRFVERMFRGALAGLARQLERGA